MQAFSEKRTYPRTVIDCPAKLQLVGGGAHRAIARNLSGGGVLLWIDQAIAPGARLQLEIKPREDITPPMVAEVRVLRSSALQDAAGGFAVACQIGRVLG